MIIEAILNGIFTLLKFVISKLPSIPDFSPGMLDSFDKFLKTIFSNTKLLGFFFPINTIKVLIPLVIVVLNFEHIYHLLIWVISWIKSHR